MLTSRMGYTSLDEVEFPPDVQGLDLDCNLFTSLQGLPTSLVYLRLGQNKIASLQGIPSGVKELHLGENENISLHGLPLGLEWLQVCDTVDYHKVMAMDMEPVITVALCGALQYVGFGECLRQDIYTLNAIPSLIVLAQVIQIPPHKRPARVVLVVLSSSSVPRVGQKAAVRRLHRADLVREMAGMLA